MLNYNGVCRAAPGFVGSAKCLGKQQWRYDKFNQDWRKSPFGVIYVIASLYGLDWVAGIHGSRQKGTKEIFGIWNSKGIDILLNASFYTFFIINQHVFLFTLEKTEQCRCSAMGVTKRKKLHFFLF